MSHCITIGQTESGKTTWNMRLAQWYKRNGIPVVVLDKYRNPGWNADFITPDPDEFLEFVQDPERCLQCALFADEAGQQIGRFAVGFDWCTTQSRHFGHRFHLITQRAQMVSMTIRSQVSICVAFNVGPKDAKAYAEEFNAPELLDAPNLPQGHFIMVQRFKGVSRGRLW